METTNGESHLTSTSPTPPTSPTTTTTTIPPNSTSSPPPPKITTPPIMTAQPATTTPTSTTTTTVAPATTTTTTTTSPPITTTTSRSNLDFQQRLSNIVELISNQEARLNTLKTFRKLARDQSTINADLKLELKKGSNLIAQKDKEIKEALNKVDNLNRQLANYKKYRRKVMQKVSFDPLALLLDAALTGELELVIKTSKQVPDLSASHDECVTALHNAVVAGHYDVAKYLIEAGCDVNVQDSEGWTPLHCAADGNNLELSKLLVENNALIFATTTSDFATPVMKCKETDENYEDCYNYLMSVQNNLGVINNGLVYALYDYEAQKEDELSFVAGDELIILRRDDSKEQNWWWAKKRKHPQTKQQQPQETSDTENDVEMTQEGYIPRNLIGLYPPKNSKNNNTV